jgi:hypothetical protein
MNSTDERLLRRFWVNRVLPAAEALRRRGVRFFPLGPEPGDSWYHGPPAAADFRRPDERALARELAARWEAEGLPELAALASPLEELAGQLEISEEETPDISPFVYVMY